MSDISKCADSLCPAKETCYRYTAPESLYWQSYGSFNREEDAYNCNMYWDNGLFCKYCHQKNGNHKISCPTMKIQVNL
jgi:hypothetical protein